MARTIASCLVCFLFALNASVAEAAQYLCKAVTKVSKLGTHDDDTVIVDPDDANQECRFSINGEPAGSPPRADLVAARNTLRAGQAAAELRNGNFQWLALMLLAASRETQVPDPFAAQLKSEVDQLAQCMTALENSDSKFSYDNQKNVFCRAQPPGLAVFEFNGQHRVEVESNAPYYVVGVDRDDDASYLFIPVGSFRGEPLP